MVKRRVSDLCFALTGLVVLTGVLSACGVAERSSERGSDQPSGTVPPPMTPSPPQQASSNVSVPGLSPLPTRQQVLASVPQGRSDPFATTQPAPPPRPPATRKAPPQPPPPLQLPADFRFTGVVNTAGRTEAIVSYGTLSGSVGHGDVGGQTTKLLPPGWTVASINLPLERLTLEADRGRRVTARLQ